MIRIDSVFRAAGAAAVLTLALGAAGLALAGSASAAPQGDAFELTCDNGTTYTVTTARGNGEFTPAMATDGTRFIPVAFGESTFEVREGDTVIESGTEPGSSKSAAASRPGTSATCSFSGGETFTEDGHTYTATYSGTVTAYLVGPKK